ncbi:hypothetical protein LTR36_003110 [Oleoguttula mirabilis]|uniref:Uncharacterized protein n=1 Tax=Oleoguttula mirabilis TaxID=1507867 RepID=A0AAV9JZS7_9PEZI|nr:hypothetical protein LTR36_003110 [Oleoguttula mirabilis]
MENSTFGKLAPELRNRIYELVLALEDEFVLKVSDIDDCLRRHPKAVQSAPLALTATCKSVRAEATPLFYATNTFVICARPLQGEDGVALLEEFRQRIGQANAVVLHSVVIDAGKLAKDAPPCRLLSAILANSAENPACTMKVRAHFRLDTQHNTEYFRLQLDVRRLGGTGKDARQKIEAKVLTARLRREAEAVRLLCHQAAESAQRFHESVQRVMARLQELQPAEETH